MKQPTINDVIIAAVEVADQENSTNLENEADDNEVSSDNTNKAEESLDSATEDEEGENDVRTQLEQLIKDSERKIYVWDKTKAMQPDNLT